MRVQLIAVFGCLCLLSTPAVAAKAKSAKSAKTKASKGKSAAEGVEGAAKGKSGQAKVSLEDFDAMTLAPDAARRIAVIPGALPKGVSKKALQAATSATEKQLKGQGLAVVGTSDLAAALRKLKVKAEPCDGEVRCLTRVAKAAGCGVAASVVLTKAGKQYMLDLTLYDARDGALVANEATVVPKAEPAAFAGALKASGPVLVAALDKHRGTVPSEPALAALASPPPPALEQPAVPEKQPAVAVALATGAAAEPKPAVEASVPAPKTAPLALSAPAPASAELSGSKWGKRILPLTLMGLGAGGIGVGVGVFGTQARSAVADFRAGRNPLGAKDTAEQAALLSDISTGAGVALMATGAALLLFTGGGSSGDAAPSPASPEPTFAVGPTGTGVAMAGTF